MNNQLRLGSSVDSRDPAAHWRKSPPRLPPPAGSLIGQRRLSGRRASLRPLGLSGTGGTYQRIVDLGRAATGARAVALMRYDSESRTVQPIVMSWPRSAAVKRGLDLVRSFLPEFDPRGIVVSVEGNEHNREVYEEGRPVATTLEDLTAGILDERVVAIARTVAQLRYAFLAPVRLGGKVAGSIGFFTARPLGEQQRVWGATLAAHAALAMENARLKETLGGQIEELERTRQAIITTEDGLRRELAEMLHGRVQTQLLGAWHRLGQSEKLLDVDPGQARALLAQVREEIDQIREREVRQVSHLLHPSIIQVGLVPAVHSLLDGMGDKVEATLHVASEVAVLDDPAHNRMPESIRLVAYRVLEEALNNVYRHSNATALGVCLSVAPEEKLLVVVRDNGQGFDPAKMKLGLGLNSISARVQQAHGTWIIRSTPGQGTTVSAELPLAWTDPRAPRSAVLGEPVGGLVTITNG